MIDQRDEVRRLKRKATDQEVATSAVQLVGAMGRYDETIRRKKEVAEDWNEQLKAIDSTISSLRQTIQDGIVEEDTAVVVTFEFDRNAVTVTHKATGELVEERAMTAQERQEREVVPLPLVESSETPGTTDFKKRAAGDTDEDDGPEPPPVASDLPGDEPQDGPPF